MYQVYLAAVFYLHFKWKEKKKFLEDPLPKIFQQADSYFVPTARGILKV